MSHRRLGSPRPLASRRRRGRSVLPLYAATLFASASLVFILEPLFARMVLPLFGGVPEVWNTCVVFYQLVLVAGYLYSHFVSRWLSVKGQVTAQIGIMALALAVLPVHPALGWMPHAGTVVVPGMLLFLAVSVGLPFFAVSTIAPLLQRWFASTGHRDALDPYFLYAASNVGSFLGLLAYPLLIERDLRVTTQSWAWAGGYALLILMVSACGFAIWRLPQTTVRAAEAARPDAITARDRIRWVLLAAVPASLMLSVTTYASTDIAPVPLLWIVPLGLYLLTFVVAFARRRVLPLWLSGGLLPLLVLPCTFTIVTELRQPLAIILPLHLVTFAVAAAVCHSQLADSRPGVSRLTEFYVWIAVGGAIGGLFNVLAAPLLFVKTTEYPLALVLTCLLRPTPRILRQAPARLLIDIATAAVPGLVFVALVFSARLSGVAPMLANQILVVSLPLLMSLGFWPWPRRFGLALLGVFLAANYGASGQPILLAQRDFFGVHQVIVQNGMHVLMNGTTNHGAQWMDPARRYDPTTYLRSDVTNRPAVHRHASRGRSGSSRRCRARFGRAGHIRAPRRTLDVLRNRSRHRADRARSDAVHDAGPPRARRARGDRRRPSLPARVDGHLRHAGARGVQLGRHPGAPPDARGNPVVPRAPRAARRARVSRVEPVSRFGAGPRERRRG